MIRKLKILVIFDFPVPPPSDGQFAEIIRPEDWRPEQNVIDALKELGHEVRLLPIYNQIRPLVLELRRHPPDLVFNLVEAYDNDRAQEANVAGLLELAGVPYTGSRAATLALCRNKAFTKRVLVPHRIKVPRSILFYRGVRTRSLRSLRFPVIVKPLGLEGSDGIAERSVVDTAEACLERVRFVHESLNSGALVEEFIEGRELYAGVLGNERLHILPLREMFWKGFPEDRAKLATFKAKWDQGFRKKWGITNSFAEPLPEGVEKKIARITRSAYRILQLSGYGRLDLRLSRDNEVYVLEVNPNPSLARDDEIAMAAARAKIEYPALVQKLVTYGLKMGSRRAPI